MSKEKITLTGIAKGFFGGLVLAGAVASGAYLGLKAKEAEIPKQESKIERKVEESVNENEIPDMVVIIDAKKRILGKIGFAGIVPPGKPGEIGYQGSGELIYSEDDGQCKITIHEDEKGTIFTNFIRKKDSKNIEFIDPKIGCIRDIEGGDIGDKEFHKYARKKKDEIDTWHTQRWKGYSLDECVKAIEKSEIGFDKEKDFDKFLYKLRLFRNPEKAFVAYVYGEEVMEIAGAQKRLEDFYDYGIKPTGIVDEKTKKAVKRFQREFRISESGELYDAYGRNGNADTIDTIYSYWRKRFGYDKDKGVLIPEDKNIQDEVRKFRFALTGRTEDKFDNEFPARFLYAYDQSKGRAGKKIDTIVLHTTEGSGTGAEEWLTSKDNIPASAHYLVMEDGEVIQLVKEENAALHCRNHNYNSIGIEFAGYHNKPINEKQKQVGGELVKYLVRKYNISKENIKAHSELDPTRRKDPGKQNMEAILSGI